MTGFDTRMMTILFADIAGSMKLYSDLGDVQAHRHIADMLQSMSSSIKRHGGRVIETIGDEIMCAFEEVNHAFDAACNIQAHIFNHHESGYNARIGLHCDLTREEHGHPYGDTVNTAARVVARAGQIMLTDKAHRSLTQQNKLRTRHFQDLSLKGKAGPHTIYQASWEQGGETCLVKTGTGKPVERRKPIRQMHLYYNENEIMLTDGTELLLGRGKQCDLQVETDNVSRIHATLKLSGGKLVLADRSTNGTFIKTREGRRSTDNEELFLHHDEWTTRCGGVISLGDPVSNKVGNLIYINRF